MSPAPVALAVASLVVGLIDVRGIEALWRRRARGAVVEAERARAADELRAIGAVLRAAERQGPAPASGEVARGVAIVRQLREGLWHAHELRRRPACRTCVGDELVLARQRGRVVELSCATCARPIEAWSAGMWPRDSFPRLPLEDAPAAGAA